ncbi:thioredoxin reductase [Lasius niger]|uniref:Thioredoxin reductase n=1 Tax=Lasius niger TaxID=67767 RepID=A0A0J7K0X7_LASNI|nr:thioredoxin reductase [Lasius niger]
MLIIGSGPAGYTAAIYAARAGLSPLLISGPQPGGQLTITSDIENYPGFSEPISGTELMESMKKQALAVGAEIQEDIITSSSLDKSANDGKYFVLTGSSGKTYQTESLIIATGAQAKWLGREDETRYRGKGVSACATCDGFFYRKQNVAVIGGGDTAAEEALFLSKIASKVYMIFRRSHLTAQKIMRDRIEATENIILVPEYNVSAIKGGGEHDLVEELSLTPSNGGPDKHLNVTGIFVAIGHVPNTGPFKEQLECDSSGYIVTKPDSTCTSVAGVFAAGDVQDSIFRQAITAAGSGCMAAMEAERYLGE